MLFKDRLEAGQKLAELLEKKFPTKFSRKDLFVISLLRGGVVLGAEIAAKLKIPHLALAVVKIAASYNPELAIGALAYDAVYLEQKLIESVDLDHAQVKKQIDLARKKFVAYSQQFNLKEKNFRKKLKNKKAIIVDDGVATGATARAANLYLRSCGAKKIFLAVPVAPVDFGEVGFDRLFVLSFEANFSAVSQFYKNFPQVTNEEVKFFFQKKKTGKYQ